MEDWITIKNLKKRNPSLGSRAIAELLGISRNTVKMALKSEDVPTYERQKEINPEIKPFQEYICERLVVKANTIWSIILIPSQSPLEKAN